MTSLFVTNYIIVCFDFRYILLISHNACFTNKYSQFFTSMKCSLNTFSRFNISMSNIASLGTGSNEFYNFTWISFFKLAFCFHFKRWLRAPLSLKHKDKMTSTLGYLTLHLKVIVRVWHHFLIIANNRALTLLGIQFQRFANKVWTIFDKYATSNV